MLYKESIAVYSENSMKPIYTLTVSGEIRLLNIGTLLVKRSDPGGRTV
jgi:hypothetical protein